MEEIPSSHLPPSTSFLHLFANVCDVMPADFLAGSSWDVYSEGGGSWQTWQWVKNLIPDSSSHLCKWKSRKSGQSKTNSERWQKKFFYKLLIVINYKLNSKSCDHVARVILYKEMKILDIMFRSYLLYMISILKLNGLELNSKLCYKCVRGTSFLTSDFL